MTPRFRARRRADAGENRSNARFHDHLSRDGGTAAAGRAAALRSLTTAQLTVASAGLLVAQLSAVATWNVLFAGPWLWISATAAATLVWTVSLVATARNHRGRPWEVIGAVVVACCGASLAAGLGLLPAEPFVRALEELRSSAAPVPVSPSMAVLGAVLGAALALLTSALALGAGSVLLAIVPLVAVTCVPGLVLGASPSPTLLGIGLAGVVTSLWATRTPPPRGLGSHPVRASWLPTTSWRDLLTAVAAATVAGLVIVNTLPAPLQRTLGLEASIGSPTRADADVLLQLGQDLRQPTPVDLFRHADETGDSTRFVLARLQDFSTGVWAPVTAESGESVANEAPTPSPPAGASEPTVTRVTIDGLDSDWLPLPLGSRGTEPAETLQPQGEQDTGQSHWDATRWQWIGGSDNARGQINTQRWDSYRVRASPVTDTQAATRSFLSSGRLPRSTDSINRTGVDPQAYLGLPENLPESITSAARSIGPGAAAGASPQNAVAWARSAVAQFTGGAYEYSEQTPLEQGFDGDNAAVIERFLSERTGYCVHFASAMAVMARAVGIPSRIAIGTTQGTRQTEVDGAPVYQVTTSNLHAWPELLIAGVGWVAFEPTPGFGSIGTGDAGSASSKPSADATASASSEPSPSTGAGDEQGADASESPSASPSVEPQSASTPASPDSWWWVVAIVAALVIIVGAPGTLRALRWQMRRRRILRGRRPGLAAWQEVRDTAVDLGADAGTSRPTKSDRWPRTPRGWSRAVLGDALGGDVPGVGLGEAGALERIVTAFEREEYGDDALASSERAAVAADVGSVRHALHACVPAWRRVAAALWPRSLTTRKGSLVPAPRRRGPTAH